MKALATKATAITSSIFQANKAYFTSEWIILGYATKGFNVTFGALKKSDTFCGAAEKLKENGLLKCKTLCTWY